MVEQIPAKNDVMIFKIAVDVLDASNSKEFKAEIVPLLDANPKAVFDMSLVTFIDSSGLGALLSCLRKLNSAGGDLRLAGLTKPARSLLELVRMHKIVETFDTTEEAVASLL